MQNISATSSELKDSGTESCSKNQLDVNILDVNTQAHKNSSRHEQIPISLETSSKFILNTQIPSVGIRYNIAFYPESFNDQGSNVGHIPEHTGNKPYKCAYCPKSFDQKIVLTRHTRIHTGEKPYQCDLCPKSFTLKQNLRVHIRSHSGEKPYQCVYCLMSFAKKETLDNHVRTHTGEKPYQCNYCSESFPHPYSLIRHTRSEHSGKTQTIAKSQLPPTQPNISSTSVIPSTSFQGQLSQDETQSMVQFELPSMQTQSLNILQTSSEVNEFVSTNPEVNQLFEDLEEILKYV